MKTDPIGQEQVSVVVMGALLGTVMILMAGVRSHGSPVEEPAGRVRFSEVVERLAELCAKDRSIAIVSFESATREALRYKDGKATGEKVQVPQTGWQTVWPEDGSWNERFVVEGEFRLVEQLSGKPVKMGSVKKVLEDFPAMPWGGSNWVWERRDVPAWDLALTFLNRVPSPGPMHFVIVGPPEAESVLDCTFLGPIGEQEIPYIRPLVKALLAGKGEAPAEEARKFLADSNPAMAMLGLVRLDALRQTTLEDYAIALARVQIPYVEEIFLGANHHVWGKESLYEPWAKALRAVFDKAEPERRSAILDAVRAYVARDTSDMARNLRKVFPELETPKPEADNTDM